VIAGTDLDRFGQPSSRAGRLADRLFTEGERRV
jgi:hypothetical protein